jgi:hypothetical protein
MRTLTFSGASDDLVHVDGGPKKYDEINTYEPVVFVIGGKVRVTVYYGDNGTWGVGLSQWEEGIDFPDWPIRFTQSDHQYSVAVEVDVPDDVSVVRET